MRVYLSGPIANCDDGEMWNWRQHAKDNLRFLGCEPVDPARRDYRGGGDPVEIVEGDLADIEGCDVILVNPWKISVGTSIEAWVAKQLGKRVVVVRQVTPMSPWLAYCADYIAADVLDACRRSAAT